MEINCDGPVEVVCVGRPGLCCGLVVDAHFMVGGGRTLLCDLRVALGVVQ
jgi:hypothetical protein